MRPSLRREFAEKLGEPRLLPAEKVALIINKTVLPENQARVITEEFKFDQHAIVVASARYNRRYPRYAIFVGWSHAKFALEPCAVLYPVAPRCVKLSDQSGGALSSVGARPCLGTWDSVRSGA